MFFIAACVRLLLVIWSYAPVVCHTHLYYDDDDDDDEDHVVLVYRVLHGGAACCLGPFTSIADIPGRRSVCSADTSLGR